MPDEHSDIVRATERDLDSVVRTLVLSHVDYAWERWALPDDHRRHTLLEELYSSFVDHVAFPYGEVWRDGTDRSAAIWLPPDVDARVPPEVNDRIETINRTAFGERHDVVAAASSAAARRHPPGHHWYLATMGTRPDHQRCGLGTAVLTPMLARLDASGATAVLETSDPGNVHFYTSLGFATIDRLAPPGGAPDTWVMLRSARMSP